MEKTGVVSYEEVLEIGTVGMAARMSGLRRDIRTSHPFNLYGSSIIHEPVIKRHGDVYSRTQIRKEEVRQSLGYIRKIIENVPEFRKPEEVHFTAASNMFCDISHRGMERRNMPLCHNRQFRQPCFIQD